MKYGGVIDYDHYILRVSMPQGKLACIYCPGMVYDKDSGTRRCRYSWDILSFPDSSIGPHCVLEEEEE